jgi:drug/metabolite transporter (DMT)-like permease
MIRHPRPTNPALWASILTVWVAWGGTYLAIRWAVEAVPPFLLTGVRGVVAGGALYAWARLRGAPGPSWANWRAAALTGILMLACGNVFLVWAERTVPSGLSALLIGASPLYFVLLDWRFFGGPRPGRIVSVGLLIGLLGLALLVGPDLATRGATFAGILAVLLANLGWALGSLVSRRAAMPASPVLATAMQMLSAAPVLLVASGLLGEWHGFSITAVPVRSWLSFGYLVVVGSWIGMSAYTVMIRHAPMSLASMYAFVNPVVAVFVGWAFAAEIVGPRMLAASAVVLAGVVLVVFGAKPALGGGEG